MDGTFKCFQVCLSVFIFSLIASCSSDEAYKPIVKNQVAVDLSLVPYPVLSDYHFFEGDMKNQQPSQGVVPYKPTSELFSDYAAKKRFLWLPEGSKATYAGAHQILEMPVGAALIKSFYYQNVQPNNTTRIIETRVMIRKADGWIFADYVWNDDQTEATLQTAGSTTSVIWTDSQNVSQSINYEIPSSVNCIACHTSGEDVLPIGIKPQNLNSNYPYPEGSKNQLAKLIEAGYLNNNLPATILSTVDYANANENLELRARSYFDINCAHCHHPEGTASYVPLDFRFEATTEPENMGVCVGTTTVVPGINHGKIIAPGNSQQSVLSYTMGTTNTFYRMPRIGRTVVHDEGVILINNWINSLPACN